MPYPGAYESIRTDLVATFVHERIHMQQLAALGPAYFDIFEGPGRTLLALSVREGVETYYEAAEEKEQAVREILAVTDYRAFLERSGYPTGASADR